MIHCVVQGGTVAGDVYVGPFRDYERAVDRALQIERRMPDVLTLVRQLFPGPTSLKVIEVEVEG